MDNPKLYFSLLGIILLVVLVFLLQDELFDFMTDPDNQVEVGMDVGITPNSKKDKENE